MRKLKADEIAKFPNSRTSAIIPPTIFYQLVLKINNNDYCLFAHLLGSYNVINKNVDRCIIIIIKHLTFYILKNEKGVDWRVVYYIMCTVFFFVPKCNSNPARLWLHHPPGDTSLQKLT